MPDRPVIPVLSYDVDPAFGWHEEDDGPDHVLVLPQRPRAERLASAGAALFASTGFMLVAGTIVVAAARAAGGGGVLAMMLLPVGLLAIAQWVLVLTGFVALARTPGVAATVRVTPHALIVTDAIAVNPRPFVTPRDRVAGLRLDAIRGLGGGLRHARLQVTSPAGTVVGLSLPWPAAEPVGPHEAKLRALLGLPPRTPDDRGG